MEKVVIETADVWNYFQQNKLTLRNNMTLLASNNEYGVLIFLTGKEDVPMICVEADGYLLEEAVIPNEQVCEDTVNELYEKYLTHRILDNEDVSNIMARFDKLISEEEEDYSHPDEEDIENAIIEREEELSDSIGLMVAIATDLEAEDISNYELVIGDIKEHMLEYMARKHNLKIRRPMFLEDEDGEEFYEEYPYDCMIFEDEDNPMYK